MIIKFTGFNNDYSFFKICDEKLNDIKDQQSLFWITKILKSINYTLDMVDKGLTGYNKLDMDDDIYTVDGKVAIYTKIFNKIGINIKFKEIEHEETIIL